MQQLLNVVNDFVPAPMEEKNVALDIDSADLKRDPTSPLVAALSKFGQLTYIRIYQGAEAWSSTPKR